MSTTGDDPAVDSDAPTPPSGFPLPDLATPPRPRRSHRTLWLSLLAATLAVALLAAGYSVVRYLLDSGSYEDGHAAYQRADCAAAIGHYDDVITGWRLVTIGDTLTRAESEKAECQAFQVAVDRQHTGNPSGALAAYAAFLPDRPPSPLTDAARNRIAELFKLPDLARLASVDSCDTLPTLRDRKLLDPAVAPTFHAACGAAYTAAVDKPKALATYSRLFADYGQDRVAADTEATMLKDTIWCLELDKFRNDPILAARTDLLPGLLNTCSRAQTTPTPTAIAEAEEFLKKFPGHRFTPEVIATLATLVNKQARADSAAKDLGVPEPLRTVGGNKAILVVHNDSTELMRIALSGPDPRVETIDGCPNCPDVTGEGNQFCRDQATLKRIELEPGEYDMAVDSPEASRTAAAYAHWVLQPGKEYFACYTLRQPNP
ncbi:MAG TPA: hypothetical protein VGX25_17790 [Actinophytocola sp.]|uniref:hypothetical protein n=1 Tax=Actinophytocola sp. TaxID=1872138 RepID=UPI002DDCA024|nr:hypothetical protein [Actinophytocola sp.]HEV2781237.1 hypothetical protein [Actinophytocola sp.]